MMVVGGRVHTGSFDKEMSKCVSLCVSVSVSVCRCLALRGQGADVMCVSVCVCAFDALFGQSCQPLGWRCGLRARGISGG